MIVAWFARLSVNRLAMLLFALAVTVGAAPARGDSRVVAQDFGGLSRVAWMVDGRSGATGPAPLVLALHGYRQVEEAEALRDAPESLEWGRLAALARAEGFVALFPGAHRGQWSLVPGLEAARRPDGAPIDDVGYLLGLVDRLVAEGVADPARLYLIGISDGAIMSYRLLCRPDAPFAAAAALIGTAHEDHIADCRPDPPPALMHLHGDNDQVLPYEGWIFRSGREVSVAEVMDHFRRLHGCTGQDGERLPDRDPDDGSTVLRLDWTGCRTEPNVVLYKIKGGGHSVPRLDAAQSDDPKRRFNRDIDSIAIAWRFMAAAAR